MSKFPRIFLIALLVAPLMVGCVVDTEESSEPGLGYDFAALDVDESDPIEQTDRSSDHGEITQETWQYGQAPISAPTPVEDTEREDGDDEGEPVPDPWKGSSTVGGGTGSDD